MDEEDGKFGKGEDVFFGEEKSTYIMLRIIAIMKTRSIMIIHQN